MESKPKIELYANQKAALRKLFPGAVLCGATGSGKTYTSLFYYKDNFSNKMLYVITTAKKRDEKDWIEEASNVGIENLTVDSWNNITKYIDIKDAFFIFDEQRVIGYGAWSKAFIRITRNNTWVLVSATPGDRWIDWMPVFIANGFYKNKTDFESQHVEYNPFVQFRQIKKYHNIDKLERLRNRVLVTMPDTRNVKINKHFILAEVDSMPYQSVLLHRWNPITNEPIRNPSDLLHSLRKVNCIFSNKKAIAKFIISLTERIIVFYNFAYELDEIIGICKELGKPYFQWNGLVHESLPLSNDWVYITQYIAGSESWNCTTTNQMLFYSLNYSYRIMNQSEGRINRINTPYKTLEYYYLTSETSIDKAIMSAISKKKKFNEHAWILKEGL